MTSKLTRERLQEIAEDGFLQHGESKVLARMALAAMDSEPVAEVLSSRPGNDTSTIDRALPVGTRLYHHAQPAPVGNEFIPKNLDRALGVLGMALPESKEEFNLQSERWIQRLIDRVIRYADEFKEQPAPVVNEDLYKLANHIASSKNGLPNEWQDWAEELEADIRRAAMLQAGNSPAHSDFCPEKIGNSPAQDQGWIPVSERMPFDEVVTLTKPMGGPFLVAYSSGAVDISWYSCWQDMAGRRGEWDGETGTLAIAMGRGKITDWMPLPAATQEVK